MDSPVRILLVAEDPLIRAGFRNVLENTSGFEVVRDISADELAKDYSDYEVILWDLGWGDESTRASMELLSETSESGIPIVALVAQENMASDAWSAGAKGILEREVDFVLLTGALRTVATGLLAFDQNVADELLPSHAAIGSSNIERLTPRELEVLQSLADGLTNKAIGTLLAVSEHTVKFHVNSILRKLGVQSRTEAVVHATRIGLILL
jgi:DNA-binding NarL/FixJ family response regulator